MNVRNSQVCYEQWSSLTKNISWFSYCIYHSNSQNTLSQQPRSEMIATYALCGFSNPGSVGILVGALITLAPERRSAITEVAFRAFIAGSATCFLTASIAGTFQIQLFLQSSLHMCEFVIHGFNLFMTEVPAIHYHKFSLKNFPWWILQALHSFSTFNPCTLCHRLPQSIPHYCTRATYYEV
jgi:hypothetical protein